LHMDTERKSLDKRKDLTVKERTNMHITSQLLAREPENEVGGPGWALLRAGDIVSGGR